jgi:3-oxoacyl-[acyl-carrier protein] reductase
VDLGLSGRSAIVCASTQGLGLACARALAAEGVDVLLNGRDPDKTAKVAEELGHQVGRTIRYVAADVTTEQGRSNILSECPSPDILVNNNAGPAPGKFLDYGKEEWQAALDANMIAPLLFVRAVLPAMRERKFGRIINIVSAMVTTPRPHMTLSAGARAGLVAALKGVALDVVRDNVTIHNLLPERFDTARQIYMAKQAAIRESIAYDEARARQVKSIAAGRLGVPSEFGAACAFLCSQHAGYMSGQNIHLDGGSYPALV